MTAIYTNVWLYSHDNRDQRKQGVAQQLIAAASPMALPWQVGCEFAILLPVPDLWPETQALQGRYSLSFWDALLACTCLRGGVQTRYTEDMGAPRTIDRLSLVNPFLGQPIP